MIRHFVAVAFLLLIASPAVRADDIRPRLRTLYDSGTSHYNLGEYKEALVDFKEAYRLSKDPAFLFNIAQCYRQLHDPAQAAQLLRSYRRESPNSPNRAEVDRLIDELDRVAATQAPPETDSATAVRPMPAPPTTERPATPATASALTASPPPRKPLSRRPWVWAVVAGGAVVIAGVVVGVTLGTAPQPPTPSVGRVNGN
jgi:tetratricopeptide (TPR) repeat protein